MNLLRRARKLDKSCLVAQRLKRLSSIETKLKSKTEMKLSQMQNIGGCRAVMGNVADVDRVVELYRRGNAKNPTRGHEFVKVSDYITTPKSDGYGGVHLVYKYCSTARQNQELNSLRVEKCGRRRSAARSSGDEAVCNGTFLSTPRQISGTAAAPAIE